MFLSPSDRHVYSTLGHAQYPKAPFGATCRNIVVMPDKSRNTELSLQRNNVEEALVLLAIMLDIPVQVN